MKVKNIFNLSIFLALFSTCLEEGLFYCNFSPLRFTHYFQDFHIHYGLSFLLVFLITFLFLFFLGQLFTFLLPIIKGLREIFLLTLICFLLFNLALSFDQEIFPKMKILGEISLLGWTFFVFYTFFYSIFYRNLIE